MGWPETHRYYAALRQVEQDLDHAGDGTVPWRAEYAEIFGDRRGLLLALRRRWDLMVQAQAEPPAAQRLRELAEEHPGLVRALHLDTARFGATKSARRWAPVRCLLGGAA
ncbi:hypothetical protein [Amycolatopsis minnesotensis]|uniref:Uncharacterized protein n=1 Tax=Amycolatopsis minnesotensis TaxID=337894 RepID=A0ABP5C6K8_9PSEU